MNSAAGTRRGFTLLELSIVLTLIGIITGMGLVTLTASIQASQYNKTTARMDAIEKALLDFSMANGRIPCPASLTLAPTNVNYGIEAATPGTCTGGTPAASFASAAHTVEGAVPTRALQLPDSTMYDGWGHRFRYAVDPAATVKGTLPAPVGGACSPSASAITVNDATGAARTTAAIYALVSHGANGHGAYTNNGTAVNAASTNTGELRNCNCTSAGVYTGTYTPTYVQKVPTLNAASALDSFDDIVSFKESWQMQAQNFPLASAATCVQYIYVTDGNCRVQKFDINGTYLSQFGSCGSGDGQFTSLWFLAADASGNIWVGDYTGLRVQKFDGNGNYLMTVGGGWGFSYGKGVTVDPGGHLWAVHGNAILSKYDSSGNSLLDVDLSSDFTYVYGVSADKDGNIWVVSPYGDLAKYDTNGNRITYFHPAGVDFLNSGIDVAADANGNVWASASWSDGNPGGNGSNHVAKFNSSGTWLAEAGCGGLEVAGCTSSSAAGYLWNPNGIAVDSSGNLWVADGKNNRIQKFDSTGHFLMQFGTYGTGPGQFDGPGDVVVTGR